MEANDKQRQVLVTHDCAAFATPLERHIMTSSYNLQWGYPLSLAEGVSAAGHIPSIRSGRWSLEQCSDSFMMLSANQFFIRFLTPFKYFPPFSGYRDNVRKIKSLASGLSFYSHTCGSCYRVLHNLLWPHRWEEMVIESVNFDSSTLKNRWRLNTKYQLKHTILP